MDSFVSDSFNSKIKPQKTPVINARVNMSAVSAMSAGAMPNRKRRLRVRHSAIRNLHSAMG